MQGLFPNDLQAALVLGAPFGGFDKLVADSRRLLAALTGREFNAPEYKPGAFVRLYGPEELMITIERTGRAPNMAVFDQSLGSVITGMLCPDVRQRLARADDMILINVGHGVFGREIHDEFGDFFKQIGFAAEGATLPQFRRRLQVLAVLARLATEHSSPLLVHWCSSNMLLPGEKFDDMAAIDAPSLMHVHPYLFGAHDQPGSEAKLGIRTFGARHFIGHELLVEPSVVPWIDNLEAMLCLIRVAIADIGYIVPDGDTFGPEDGSFSARVMHRPADEGGVPVLEIIPLMHRESGFVSPDYVPRERVIDDRSPPPSLMPAEDEDKAELANEWREKRRLAEGIGGRFEVRARGDAPLPPASPPRPGFLGGRAVFGRKKG